MIVEKGHKVYKYGRTTWYYVDSFRDWLISVNMLLYLKLKAQNWYPNQMIKYTRKYQEYSDYIL